MGEVLGGATIVVLLFVLAGLIGIAKKLLHKMVHSFQKEIVASLAEISANLEQVNTAVNHVGKGTPPLTERVDANAANIKSIGATLEEFKESTEEKFNETTKKLDENNAAVEMLISSHVETRKKFEEVIKAMPKRSGDKNEVA